MKTIYYTDEKGAKAIVNGLTEIFGTKENEPVYSLGFKRLQKLSMKKRSDCFKSLFIEGYGSGLENHTELKIRLEKMTDEEFKAFKK